MSVEKTLHVQVIYIQGHFSMEWQVKSSGDTEIKWVKNTIPVTAWGARYKMVAQYR